MVGKRLGVLLLLLLALVSSHSTDSQRIHIGHSHHVHGEEDHEHAHGSGEEQHHGSGMDHSHGAKHVHTPGHAHSSEHGHSHGQGSPVFAKYVDLLSLQKFSEELGTAGSAYACTALLSISAVVVFAVLGVVRKVISDGVLNALMACAAGSLLGDVFLHALPEMDKSMDNWILIITGIFLFYLLDKLFTSGHSHKPAHSPVFLYLLADAAHNFMDGMAIAVAFRTTPILGITTSLAVLFHELPHELADFIVLIKSGRSLGKALWLQCLTGVVALAGTWVALADVSKEQVDRVGLPLVVGNFLYLAMVNILGELRASKGGLISESVGFLLGAYLMLKLALLE